jgi:hypothetical protein
MKNKWILKHILSDQLLQYVKLQLFNVKLTKEKAIKSMRELRALKRQLEKESNLKL